MRKVITIAAIVVTLFILTGCENPRVMSVGIVTKACENKSGCLEKEYTYIVTVRCKSNVGFDKYDLYTNDKYYVGDTIRISKTKK